MFRRQPAPAPPPALSFGDVLSDLAAVMQANRVEEGGGRPAGAGAEPPRESTTTSAAFTWVLGVLPEEDGGAIGNGNPDTDDRTLLEGLKRAADSPTPNPSQRSLADAYDLCARFIGANARLLDANERLEQLGNEVDVLRKELGEIVKTVAFSGLTKAPNDDERSL